VNAINSLGQQWSDGQLSNLAGCLHVDAHSHNNKTTIHI
jgi:hypothetical protein